MLKRTKWIKDFKFLDIRVITEAIIPFYIYDIKGDEEFREKIMGLFGYFKKDPTRYIYQIFKSIRIDDVDYEYTSAKLHLINLIILNTDNVTFPNIVLPRLEAFKSNNTEQFLFYLEKNQFVRLRKLNIVFDKDMRQSLMEAEPDALKSIDRLQLTVSESEKVPLYLFKGLKYFSLYNLDGHDINFIIKENIDILKNLTYLDLLMYCEIKNPMLLFANLKKIKRMVLETNSENLLNALFKMTKILENLDYLILIIDGNCDVYFNNIFKRLRKLRIENQKGQLVTFNFKNQNFPNLKELSVFNISLNADTFVNLEKLSILGKEFTGNLNALDTLMNVNELVLRLTDRRVIDYLYKSKMKFGNITKFTATVKYEDITKLETLLRFTFTSLSQLNLYIHKKRNVPERIILRGLFCKTNIFWITEN